MGESEKSLPVFLLSFSVKTMNLSRYCARYPDFKKNSRITLFSTKTGSVVTISADVIQDIEQGRLSAEERKTLKTEGFLVRSADQEKKELLHFIEKLNLGSEIFNAMVVLNLDCNLGCTYCFEGARKGKHYLKAETADQFVNFVKRQDLDEKEQINIVFYGGEPLLSTDMIEHISEQLGTVAKKRGLEYTFSLITNGTLLTSRTVRKLASQGLKSASVTLDGPCDVHDRFRPFKSGNGSFDTIIGNMQDVCSMIDVQIGGNYTRANYRKFPRLLDYLIDTGLTPRKIAGVQFDPVINESNEFAPPDFHDGCISINEPWLFQAGIFLREEILKRGFRTPEIAPAVCMIELKNNLVVNYDGSLYKCPGLIGRKKFRVGSVKTGVVDYDQRHNLGNWKNEECLDCAISPSASEAADT